ncbi:MAG: hypothetical protein HPY65_00810 [Syntrophaceae bacterium]|nr:hypothetical protein [Syntrophaceae bacterium]
MNHVLSVGKLRDLHRAVERNFLKLQGIPSGAEIRAQSIRDIKTRDLVKVEYQYGSKKIVVLAKTVQQLHRFAEREYLKSVGFQSDLSIQAKLIQDETGKIIAVEFHQDMTPDVPSGKAESTS